MRPRNAHDEQVSALRERLSRLSEASLRINESLDLDAVLQGVLDSARSLTGARYALITTMRNTGEVEDFVVSGLTAEEAQRLWEVPERMQLFSYFGAIPAPLRVPDFAAHMREMGLAALRLPVPISSFIAAPIRHRGVSVGNIHVAKDLPGLAFTREDEETLVMFASQVALVVANARRHRDERRARADLETLIDTSPVGVAVFALGTGCSGVVQPRGEADRRWLAEPGPDDGTTPAGADRAARRRAPVLPGGVALSPRRSAPARRCGPRRS